LRLRDAIETVSEAFVLWDADNRLVMCNSKFQKFHHLSNDAIAARNALCASDGERKRPRHFRRKSRSANGRLPGRAPTRRGLAIGRWLQINERRTKDGRYVSVGTDITALKRHEEQLMDSEAPAHGDRRRSTQNRGKPGVAGAAARHLAEKYLEQKAEAETANRAKIRIPREYEPRAADTAQSHHWLCDAMQKRRSAPWDRQNIPIIANTSCKAASVCSAVITDVSTCRVLESGRFQIQKTDFEIDTAVSAAVAEIAAIATEKEISVVAETLPGKRIHADHKAIEKILTILLRNAVQIHAKSRPRQLRARMVQGALNVYVEDTE